MLDSNSSKSGFGFESKADSERRSRELNSLTPTGDLYHDLHTYYSVLGQPMPEFLRQLSQVKEPKVIGSIYLIPNSPEMAEFFSQQINLLEQQLSQPVANLELLTAQKLVLERIRDQDMLNTNS